MSKIHVGIDAAAESFAASVFFHPERVETAPQVFGNSAEGIDAFEAWLRGQKVDLKQALFCIENTGVYSERLCYILHERGYQLTLLDPRTLWKAFGDGQPKNDPLDSQKISEYGFRYSDRLRPWQPQEEIIEQIRVILRTREQLVGQKTATRNARTTLSRKVVQTPAANRALENTLAHLTDQIKALEKELERLIRSKPTLMQNVALLLSAPGVGWLLSAHFVVLTRGFTEIPNYRELAQYTGISPNEHTSGTSVRKKPTSRRYGPSTLRKLLHLAARSVRTHNPEFKKYFLEKTATGKPKPLVFNNIANKLLKRLCAMLKTRKPYIHGHQSVDPRLLTLA